MTPSISALQKAVIKNGIDLRKRSLILHLSGTDSKTHSDAAVFLMEIAQTKQRGRMVVKNQLRAIINVVKSKAAALHYEDHVA